MTNRVCKKTIGWYAGVKEERYISLSDEPARKWAEARTRKQMQIALLDPPISSSSEHRYAINNLPRSQPPSSFSFDFIRCYCVSFLNPKAMPTILSNSAQCVQPQLCSAIIDIDIRKVTPNKQFLLYHVPVSQLCAIRNVVSQSQLELIFKVHFTTMNLNRVYQNLFSHKWCLLSFQLTIVNSSCVVFFFFFLKKRCVKTEKKYDTVKYEI